MEKSVFQSTMQELDRRITLYTQRGVPCENELYKFAGSAIRTISDVLVYIGHYDFDTAINPTMRSIYQAQSLGFIQQKLAKHMPNVLEPASEGEESITEKGDNLEPSFHWISRRFVDSRLLKIDFPEPARIQYKTPVSQGWIKCKDLILKNISPKFLLTHNNDSCTSFVKSKMERIASNAKFKRTQQIYYRGREAILIKFRDEYSAMLSYSCISRNLNVFRDFFGQEIELGRISENQLHDKPPGWVAIVIRKLPINTAKDSLLSLLRKADLKVSWVEEPVQLGDYKCALVGIEYLDEVFKITDFFRTSTSCKDFKHEDLVNTQIESMMSSF